MGLIIRIFLVFMVSIGFAAESFAVWQEPLEIISGSWGNGAKQFGLEQGDSGDTFPLIQAITPDQKIAITDSVNKKQIVFGLDGSFIKEVKWAMKSQYGDRTYYDISEYSFGPVVGYSSDGNIYTGSGSKYFLKSPTGQLIKTYTEWPAELGKVTEKPVGSTKAKIIVQYPDKTWSYTDVGRMSSYMRDTNGNLYGCGNTQVIRYTTCGKEAAMLMMPKKIVQETSRGPQVEPQVTVLEEYGSPVIAPNGDVYTWKRTPTAYSIIKWTWADDPTTPVNAPDMPENFSLKIAPTGINLFWKAVPQDPGCVTGYEIVRSTTAGGPYSALATLSPGMANSVGTIKYTDTTAEIGTIYYYKVRAVAGVEYSPYTGEVSGKR